MATNKGQVFLFTACMCLPNKLI